MAADSWVEDPVDLMKTSFDLDTNEGNTRSQRTHEKERIVIQGPKNALHPLIRTVSLKSLSKWSSVK